MFGWEQPNLSEAEVQEVTICSGCSRGFFVVGIIEGGLDSDCAGITTEGIFPGQRGIVFSPQCHVKNHHDGKSEQGAAGGKVAVAVALRFRNQLFDHHKQHGAGGKGQSVG